MSHESSVSFSNLEQRWTAPRTGGALREPDLSVSSVSGRDDASTTEAIRQRAHQVAEHHSGHRPAQPDRLAKLVATIAQILDLAAREGRLDQTSFVDDQVRAAALSLPRGDASLPHLTAGPSAGLPRVYDLMRHFVEDVAGAMDSDRLGDYLNAYQSVAPLTQGELWAVPAMLRIALLDQLHRETLAARPQHPPGIPLRQMPRLLHGLRSLGELDWKPLAESLSMIDRLLRQDPAETYAAMDFESRQHYRSVIVHLARRSPLREEDVARHALELAQAGNRESSGDVAKGHVGHYLVGPGRPLLEARVAYRPSWREALPRAILRAPLLSYLSTIGVLGIVLVAAIVILVGWHNPHLGLFTTLILLLLLAGVVADLAVRVTNGLVGNFLSPQPLMRLDFSGGIPVAHRTLVVIPTLLTSAAGVRKLAEHLETRYLANRDANLLFALLTDLPDAAAETLLEDAPLLDLARAEIEQLNARHGRASWSPFYLLHRPRRFNAQDGVWMGEERKRGKLAALNRLLHSGIPEAFTLTVGELSHLRGVRYVLTLDTDTQLPRDSARLLVGTMAHPLNRPRLDPRTQLVVSGYGVLQPRVGTTLPEALQSPYSRLLAGEAGIDPYTHHTSDVYQDLFGRGSFIGKGLYDLEAFEKSLAQRFPENRVLSHDLIEGAFAGSGLASDVVLFEGFPATFLSDMSRRHRWIRGDWQIAAWLAPTIPSASGKVRNPLSGQARWKILDNLRRSLTPLCLLGLLLAGWLLLPSWALNWTELVLLLVLGPAMLSTVRSLLAKPEVTPWRLHLTTQGHSFAKVLAQEAFHLSVLPYTVHCHLDAIVRTLYRLHISHRRLLEWTTSSDAEIRSRGGCRDHYEVMWACPIAAQATAAALAILSPLALLAALPLLAAWLLGPLVAWRLSLASPRQARPCPAPQRAALRRWARQTWHFFDTYGNASHHGLPPDHIRREEDWIVDHRTSTTNIGMGLLANLAAYDLGYLTADSLLDRSARALETLGRLERYRGHFFNWYDLRTLEPIEPRYVSTVDSGNLWASLLVLRAGILELADQPVVPQRLRQGIHDTVAVITSLRASHRSPPAPAFDEQLARLQQLGEERTLAPDRLFGEFLLRVLGHAQSLLATLPEGNPPLEEWVRALLRMGHDARESLDRFVFWEKVPPLAAPFHPTIAIWAVPLQTLTASLDRLTHCCTLRQLPKYADEVCTQVSDLLQVLAQANGDPAIEAFRDALRALAQAAEAAGQAARRELERLQTLAAACDELAEMDFRFLFHPQRRLFCIGYNASTRQRDAGYYDLLASEARLTSFLAVASGQLPQEHWSTLGRPMTLLEGELSLLSWSGSMFEYLMPMLFLPCHGETVVERSCRTAVRHQMRHARQLGIPWGISESCFSTGNDFGYQAFGVPGLRLDPDQGQHRVVAPYASALALLVDAQEATANLRRLEQAGYVCPYGFFDAIDYTPERCLNGQPRPCPLVMAHHSGMTLLALVHLLADQPTPRRLYTDRRCLAHDLLLQERMPQAVCPVAPRVNHEPPEPATP